MRRGDFAGIVEKISSKLASWKGHLLNKLGRVVLANAVIATIPSYNMQAMLFPQYICDYIDKTDCSFIWKGF